MIVSCSNCATKFNVPDAKVAGKRARMKCKRCGTTIAIDGTQLGSQSTWAPPSSALSRPSASRPHNSSPFNEPAPELRDISPRWRVADELGRRAELSLDELAALYKTDRLSEGSLICAPGKTAWLPPAQFPELQRRAGRKVTATRPPLPTFSDETVALGQAETEVLKHQSRIPPGVTSRNPPDASPQGLFNEHDVMSAMSSFDNLKSVRPDAAAFGSRAPASSGNPSSSRPPPPSHRPPAPIAPGAFPPFPPVGSFPASGAYSNNARQVVGAQQVVSTQTAQQGAPQAYQPSWSSQAERPSQGYASVPAGINAARATRIGASTAIGVAPPAPGSSPLAFAPPTAAVPARRLSSVPAPPSYVPPPPGTPFSRSQPAVPPAFPQHAGPGTHAQAMHHAPPPSSGPPPLSHSQPSTASLSYQPALPPPFIPTHPGQAPAYTASPAAPNRNWDFDVSLSRVEIEEPPLPNKRGPGFWLLVALIPLVAVGIAIYQFQPTWTAKARVAGSQLLEKFKPQPAAQPTVQGPSFDTKTAGKVLGETAREADKCKATVGPVGKGRARVLFDPSGDAIEVAVSEPFHQTPVGQCVIQLFMKTKVPAFGGQAVIVNKTFEIK